MNNNDILLMREGIKQPTHEEVKVLAKLAASYIQLYRILHIDDKTVQEFI